MLEKAAYDFKHLFDDIADTFAKERNFFECLRLNSVRSAFQYLRCSAIDQPNNFFRSTIFVLDTKDRYAILFEIIPSLACMTCFFPGSKDMTEPKIKKAVSQMGKTTSPMPFGMRYAIIILAKG